jgi:L-malate glycosyltransferase
MKIFHLITSLKIGGAESALCNFLEYDINPSYKHFVVCFYSGPNVIRLKNLKIPTYHLTGIISSYDPIAIYKLVKLILKLKPDVIHAALWSATIIGRVIGKILNIPVICDIHGDCKHHGIFRNTLDKLTISFPKQFIAVSNSVERSFKNTFKLDQSKITVIENGIDQKKLFAKTLTKKLHRQDFGFSEKDFIIGSVGRLEKIKSYDVLIKAFSNFLQINQKNAAHIHLCLVGNGPEKNQLEKLAKELNISENILFTGFKIDSYKFYQLFDCFALSSQSEGLSIAVLEALCFGLPIVTTHNSNSHDVITNGENGFIIPLNDTKLLASMFDYLYNNPILRLKFSAKNKNLVKSRFHIDTTVAKYHDIYDKLFKKA